MSEFDAQAEELDLTDTVPGDEIAQKLWPNICSARARLRQLVLKRCGLGPHAFREFGTLLAEDEGQASTLETLDLSSNNCGQGGLRGEFCEGVLKNKRITSIELGCCSLGDQGIVPLAEVLAMRFPQVREPPKLQRLGLSCNGLGPGAAASLGHCLTTNFALRQLDLKANSLGPEGAASLAEGLRANKGRLQWLDASQNAIKLDGARALASVFAEQEFSFCIRLERPFGVSCGLVLDESLRVTGIEIRGLVDAWNEVHPSDAVFVDDRISRVNDTDELEAMREELTSQERLEVTLTRSGVGLKHVDVCHNAITSAGVEEIRNMFEKPKEGFLQGWQLRFDGGARQLWITAH
mmetsp:Transcript_33654/g.106911  ORF Transcript_33654/g.106911 Transcript_33654/m.106911 type:complete len:351 (-) Transcript_33654:65-1117(-)